jgi:hypothetical protein
MFHSGLPLILPTQPNREIAAGRVYAVNQRDLKIGLESGLHKKTPARNGYWVDIAGLPATWTSPLVWLSNLSSAVATQSATF